MSGVAIGRDALRRVRKCFALTVVALCVAAPAFAETVAERWTFVKTGNNDGNYAYSNAWKDSDGVSRTWTAETSAEQIDYIIPKGYTFHTGYGHTDETEFMLPQNTDSTVTLYGTIQVMWIHTTIPNLVMKDSSRIYLHLANNASGANFRKPRRVSGSARIDASDSAPAIFDTWGYFANQMQTNAMIMTGSGAIRYTHTPRDSGKPGQIVVTGDNSGFTGPVSILKSGTAADKNMHLYVSSSENIGGNPATFKEKGLEINGAYLHIRGDTALGENRGFYVSGDSSTVDVSSGATFTVPTEIGFADGGYTLAKTGAGTMKVPGWSADGAVSLASGTLEITGASVANGTVTPVSIGSLSVSNGTNLRVVLSGDGSELAVGRYTILSSVSLPDNIDSFLTVVNAGAFTLPDGKADSYSVDKNGNLVMTVAERWTLVKNGGDGNYKAENAWTNSFGTYKTWTAETSAEQIDYIIPKGYTFHTGYGHTDETEFMLPQNTDSTVTLYGTIQVMWIHTTIPNLVMKDSSRIYLHLANNASGANFRKPRRVSGSARIDASDSAPAIFDTWGYFANQMQTNAMIMTGSGAIRYTHTPRDSGKPGQIVVTGDNSGFTGPVSILKSGTAADKNMHLYVSSSENIGGNPATFKEKGLEINGAYLHIRGDTALGENRGFYVSGDSSTVDVSSGATFTVPTEIGFADGGYTLAKTGAGTVKVPGWTTGKVAVNAGTLNLVGATFANGAPGTPVSIGGIEYADGATVTLAVEGDGSELPMANATNVLLVAESALPADFADKVQLVGGDSAYTVPLRLKTRLVVVDGTKLALETEKSKGFMLIVK